MQPQPWQVEIQDPETLVAWAAAVRPQALRLQVVVDEDWLAETISDGLVGNHGELIERDGQLVPGVRVFQPLPEGEGSAIPETQGA